MYQLQPPKTIHQDDEHYFSHYFSTLEEAKKFILEDAHKMYSLNEDLDLVHPNGDTIVKNGELYSPGDDENYDTDN